MKRPAPYLTAAIVIGAFWHTHVARAQCTIPDTVSTGAYTVRRNLYYTQTRVKVQSINIYRPAGAVQPPVILALHQGSFTTGNDTQFNSFGQKMATFGIATAEINYRLESDGQNVFPAAISDIRCAIRWLSARAASLNISATNYAVLGTSAGGNIAGLLATNARPDATFDSTPNCLAPYSTHPQPAMTAFADYYGLNAINVQSAMNQIQTRNATHYLGVSPTANPALAAKASPLTYVSSTTPQTFLARGTADSTMPEPQASLMQAALQSDGVAVQYWQVDGLGHGFEPLDVQDYPQLQDSACALVAFFQTALGVTPPAKK